MNIVVLDGFTMNPGDLSWNELAELGSLKVYDRTSAGQVLERAKDAEVILTNKTVIDAASLRSLPKLKYVGVLATGYNVVDINVARELCIVVTNIPAYSTESVAQMVFAHILNITHRVGRYSDEARSGVWSRQADFSYTNSPLMELCGKKIGIVGFGNTGSATARIAVAFGMEVLAYTSKPQSALPAGVTKADSIDDIFRMSDIVSLHCPLNKETSEIANAAHLSLMKKSAILINTGRGGLVNEQDLADALRENRIKAAGLDVMVNEPPREDNPLLKLDNCFITPHIAWATYEARVRLMNQTVKNLRSFIEGNIINNVAL
ncbi:D-2-hydroxyacid dehydrogenase [Bacteroides caecigallinarum]|uniref:D-2-hydroxyacid dehydrogenase n=1 Tax=Bacteroides caecigallinarum TaxID=1411144 RepID=UPI0019587BD0|nr:D-2-hydroxyacid dehydrogenase [Bacteroides caecigallinarum]MBM6864085.1 D-2-hydroxyacid dehydrogenase [Bacteroides caecigallinarum]MBU3809093.1 D-2-hydroxyacid dehydrogenase [Candidatus Phocaeicola faecipullorum]